MIIHTASKQKYNICCSSLDPWILAIFKTKLHLQVIWQGDGV